MACFHTKMPRMDCFLTKMPHVACSLTKTPPVASFLTKMALNLTAVIKQLVARVNVLSCLGGMGLGADPLRPKLIVVDFYFWCDFYTVQHQLAESITPDDVSPGV